MTATNDSRVTHRDGYANMLKELRHSYYLCGLIEANAWRKK